MTKLMGKKKNLSIITKPWFVIIVCLICFGILTPKIFMPLFRQLTGTGKSEDRNTQTNNIRMRPPMPPKSGPGGDQADFSRSGPQFGRQPAGSPTYGGQTGGSSSKSLLSFLLPVYATGIGIYMVYTLYKVFNKNEEEKKEVDEEDEFEASKKNAFKFNEKNLGKNVIWNAEKGEFKYINSKLNSLKISEESEDELNDYERYKDLDPEYVEFLKEKRRINKQQIKQASLASTTKQSLKTDQIPLSPGSGLTSITNTNVLMNDTLERMKFSLNKINTQLIDVEKKGGPLDDPELESLRFQLTQTELQMAKIMNIVNNVSTTIQGSFKQDKEIEENQQETEEKDDDAEDLEDLHRQVELIKQAVDKTEKKSKRTKNNGKIKNKVVYDKIKENIIAAESLLRNRKNLVPQSDHIKDVVTDLNKYINERTNKQPETKSAESDSSSSSSEETASLSPPSHESDKENLSSNEEPADSKDSDSQEEEEEEEESDSEPDYPVENLTYHGLLYNDNHRKTKNKNV
jgi:hypothetical protein